MDSKEVNKTVKALYNKYLMLEKIRKINYTQWEPQAEIHKKACYDILTCKRAIGAMNRENLYKLSKMQYDLKFVSSLDFVFYLSTCVKI